MATNNDPNVIVTLVAHGHRAHDVWADSHNESFYLPPLSQAVNEDLREVVVSPDDVFRQLTPSDEDPALTEVSEPALRLTFNKKPKNPNLGYLLGSDRESCDILLGTLDDCISHRMFAISFNQYDEVIMKSSSRNQTVVSYGTQIGKRRNFTWIFPPVQKKVSVKAAKTIMFSIEIPTHETDKAAYQTNCRNFMKLVSSARHTMNLLNISSRSDTRLASGAATPDATAEPPFYLRIGRIGNGDSGVVYKARSMPDGLTVAVKRFRLKNTWTLKADVLRKLSKTPHNNIVKFIDFGLEDKQFLTMGLAPGGNLEAQCRIMPFTIREVGLILHQLLDALVYLHEDFQITHGNIKPANILCDSRAHFRLADFGLAATKQGGFGETFKATQPFMAPELLFNIPHTAAVDLWSLGVVIFWLVSPNGSLRYNGLTWCAAVVAHFKKYEECFQASGSSAPKQSGLNSLVGQHMLKMRPQDRESALGCLDRGTSLWQLLDEDSDDGAKTSTREGSDGRSPDTPRADNANRSSKETGPEEESGPGQERGSEEERGPSGEIEYAGDDDSGVGTESREAETGPKRASQGWRPASPAAPMGVRKPAQRRKKSSLSKSNTESFAAVAAQQAAEEQEQREEQALLDDYPGLPMVRPQIPGLLVRTVQRTNSPRRSKVLDELSGTVQLFERTS